MTDQSLWPRLADLPLVIEGCEYERLHAVLAYESERVTTHVRLAGAGAEGVGEDVSVHVEDGSSLHERHPHLALEGDWTLAGLCDHLATLELWSEPPEWPAAVNFRNWAFESAALDLRNAVTFRRCQASRSSRTTTATLVGKSVTAIASRAPTQYINSRPGVLMFAERRRFPELQVIRLPLRLSDEGSTCLLRSSRRRTRCWR